MHYKWYQYFLTTFGTWSIGFRLNWFRVSCNICICIYCLVIIVNALHRPCWHHWLLHISIRPARLMAVPFGDYIPEEVKLVLLDAIPWLSDLLGKDKSRENQQPWTFQVHIEMWAKVGRVIRSQRPSPPTQQIDSQRPSPPTQQIGSQPWDMRLGMWDLRYGTWDMGLGIWDLGYGTWDMGLGIWDLGYGTWDMRLGIWDLGYGILDLRYGTCDMGLGICT